MARQNFSLQHQSNIELTRNESKEKYQLWAGLLSYTEIVLQRVNF